MKKQSRSCKYCNTPFHTFDDSKEFCTTNCEGIFNSVKDLIDKEVCGAEHPNICYTCGNSIKEYTPFREKNKHFCTYGCKVYATIVLPKMHNKKKCRNCGCECNKSFCCRSCYNAFKLARSKEERTKNQDFVNSKPRVNPRKLPYSVLNRLAEKKRLEEEWERLVRWK